MARIFKQNNGRIAVWGDWLNNQPMPVGWTLITEYDEASHQATHDYISRESASASWNSATQELSVNGDVVIDSTWIAEAQAELQAKQNRQQRLTDLRATNPDALRLSDFDTESPAIQALVQKIVWLEAEIRQLRDG